MNARRAAQPAEFILGAREGAELLRFARARIGERFGGPTAERPDGAWAHEPGAAFVTLRWPDGELQGCIGSLEARRPLVEDVGDNAISAAFLDPRAAPLTAEDLDRLAIEVSVLTPLEPVTFDGTEEGARAALVPGRDGVVLRWRGRRATFLPQMWGEMPDRGEFLDELKRKAGLPRSFWAPDCELYRYAVLAFHDEGRGGPRGVS